MNIAVPSNPSHKVFPLRGRLRERLRFYFLLYLRLVSSRVRSQMQYRLSFMLEVVGTFLITSADMAALLVMFTHAPALGGWSLGEVIFLSGLTTGSFALHELFQGAFDHDVFATYIQRGTFDQLLIRPLPLSFQMFTEYFMLRRLGRITQGVLALGLGIVLARPSLTLVKILYLLVVVASGALFFMALSIVGCVLCFWTVQGTEIVNIFTYGGSTMLSYPLTIYQEWLQRFFVYILPMAFINYLPALYLLDKPTPFGLPGWLPFLAPLVCGAMFALAWRAWRLGVAHYQSTGS